MILSSPATELIIEREFNAPARLIFEAWTQSEHMSRWLCPEGFQVLFVDSDAQVGGHWRAGIRSPEGMEYVMKGIFKELSEYDRLVLSHTWEEEMGDGQPAGHDTLITIDLTQDGEHTKMRFHQSVFKTIEARDGHGGGWTGAFNNLARFIEDQ